MKQISRLAAVIAGVVVLLGVSACNTARLPSFDGFSLSSEPLTGKFIWHDLITDEPDSARRFYGGLLGWDFEDTSLPDGRSYVLARSGNTYVGGIVHMEDPGNGVDYSRWLGYMSVNDVDAAIETTVADGGSVLVEKQIENIGRVAAIQDPQGAVLGLIRSEHGDPDDSTTGPGKVVWNELLAKDDEQAAAFYRALAGYRVETLSRRGGRYHLLNADDRVRAGILKNPLEGAPPAWLTYFAVSDPAAAADKAESLGGRVLLAPSAEYRDGTQALVADPGGALLVLQKWPL